MKKKSVNEKRYSTLISYFGAGSYLLGVAVGLFVATILSRSGATTTHAEFLAFIVSLIAFVLLSTYLTLRKGYRVDRITPLEVE